MKLPLDYLIERYQSNLFATSFNVCKNVEDAKDMVQNAFIAYHNTLQDFNDEQHIKAWLLRVVINYSKNVTKSFWHRNTSSLDEYMESLTFESEVESNVLHSVLMLPEKYRIVIHLFYYEEYSIKEIAAILKISESLVKTRLSRARAKLKIHLKEDFDYEE